MTTNDKGALRKDLLQRRRSLDPAAIHRLSAQIAEQVCQSSVFANSSSIAAYLPIANEVDCRPVIEAAWQSDKVVLLPVIQRSGAMQFFPYGKSTPLRKNFFGIDEPAAQAQAPLAAAEIDLVLLPLVGFDCRGYRLGMGGGYYDHHLGESRGKAPGHSARLIGLAYDFQRLDALPDDEWDIPLDGVVTESGITDF